MIETVTDQQRVDKLSSDAIGGMTEEIASQLYQFLTHDDPDVRRRAFGAFEYSPKDETERNQIDYDRVVTEAARILRDDSHGNSELELRIYDTLTFVLENHAPQTVEIFDTRDKEWVHELLNHDIYVYRELSCTVLGQIGNTEDIERLKECAANDESAEVREAAQEAINKSDS